MFDDFHNKIQDMHHDSSLITLYFIANVMITIAYICIPLVLMRLNRASKTFITKPLYVSFAIFIFCAGVTRFLNVVSIWYSPYWLISIFDFITGTVAMYALYVLWMTVVQQKRLPSYKEVCLRYDRMQEEMRKTKAELLDTKKKFNQVIELGEEIKKIIC